MRIPQRPNGLVGVVMKTILLASVAALFIVPALAADLPTRKAPEPAPLPTEYDWTGAYFGANLGWDWTHTSYNSYAYNVAVPTKTYFNGYPEGNGSYSNSSFLGGGQVGYRYMFPQRFVIGAEANLDWNSGSSTTITSYTSSGAISTIHDSGSSGLGGKVVGVAGYAWGDFLPYIKGGWAWDNATVTRTQIYGKTGSLAALSATNQTISEQATVNRSGWTIGGGLAYHVWQNWEVFGQYMYTKYNTANVNYLYSQRQSQSSVNANAITFGVNLKM